MKPFVGILMDALFIALLIWCSVTDLKKRIIPNLVISMLLFLGLFHVGFIIASHNTWWIYPSGLLLAVPFFIAWIRGSIGAGDVKLVIAITLYMGLLKSILAFMIMLPMLIALIFHSLIKRKTVKFTIPLAPVLSVGVISTLLLETYIL